MNLLQKITGLFQASSAAMPGPDAATREMPDAGIEQRTPAAWQALLNNWDGDTRGLSDPYRLSPWVSAAIKHIARPIAGVDLDFSNPDTDVEIEDAAMKAFWASPAKGLGKSRLSRFDFIEATVGWLSLKGCYFWILDDTWMNPRTKVKSPLVIARPDDMKPIWDGGELVGWRWQTKTHCLDLIPEMVVTSAFWSPDDNVNGAAPMDAARQAAEADFAAGKFWKSLAESNGDLGQTVIAPNGITPEQQEQVIRALRAKRAAAQKGKFQPLFLVGDLKTEDAKIQSPDAQAVTQRLQSRHEVFIAFGVPPSFAEVMASYSIGSASDRYKLIEETCIPHAKKIAEGIEQVELMRSGMRVSAEFCFDDHSTMQQVRAEKFEAGRKLHERGVPWEVISDMLNLGMPKFAGADVAWLPFNLQAVQAQVAEVPAVEAVPVEDGAPVKVFEELEALLRGCPVHGTHGKQANHRKANNAKRWERLMKARAPHVKRMRVVIDRALFDARKETLANIAAAEQAERAVRSGAFDFIFDLARFLEALIEPLFKLSGAAYEAAGTEVMADDMGLSDPFIPADPNGIAWLQGRKNFIKDAGQEVWEEIRNSLEEGVSAGESYSKLAARVRENFNGLSKERSMRIAMTEVSIAFESGRHDGMIQAGAEWKEWLHSGLTENARPAHMALDGKIIPMDEPFDVNGVEMMYPCDPNGTPGEIIRCHCIHGPANEPAPQPSLDDVSGNNPDLGIPF